MIIGEWNNMPLLGSPPSAENRIKDKKTPPAGPLIIEGQ